MMGSTEDNSPLWGSGQFSYPDFSRPSAVSAWPEPSNPSSTQLSFDPYGASRDSSDYAELKADSFLHQQHLHSMGAPPVPHGGFLPSLIQHPPFLNGHNVLLPESGPYLSPMLAVQNQHLSPDGGYSSPGSVGSEYFGAAYHQPQEYMAAMSPYSNMIPSVEPEVPVEQPIKEETQEPQPVYAQQLEYIVQSVDDSKPIIHENIMLCPPMNLESQQMQPSPVPAPEQMQFHVPAPVVQQPRHTPTQQQPVEMTHDEVDRLIYRQRYVAPPTDNQQPSTSRAPVASIPVTAAHRVVASVDLDSPSPSEMDEDLDQADLTSVDPQDRRSARPSVIEHSNFECDQCGNFFARQCGLTQHKKWIHSPRMIPCEKCGKKFLTQDELDKHIVKHTQKDKPHKCPVCPKQFCHKNDLRRHMFRHSDKVPFACEICHRGFIRADHLAAHELSHERRRKINAKAKADASMKKADDGGKKKKK